MKADAKRMLGYMVELGKLHSFRDPLAGLDGADLTGAQRHAVVWLGEQGPLSTSTLATRIGASVPTCTGVVDRLEKIGLVERTRSETDRRIVEVSLSDEGERLFGLMHAALLERFSFILGSLSTQDRKDLLSILGRLIEGLQKAREQES